MGKHRTRNDLTLDQIKELLDYDPTTGLLTWRIRAGQPMFNARCAGHNVTCRHTQGYLRIGLHYKRYLVHRIVWLLMTGTWPKHQIDHINGNKKDNRWCNLREATYSQNGCNRGKPRNNTSGLKGVSWHKGQQKWRADISVNGQQQWLGTYTCPAAAHLAYQLATLQLHGNYAFIETN